MVNEEIRDAMKSRPRTPIKAIDFLSTGSTLLNLACSGRPRCGFAKGHYYYLVGDSSSGKTFLALTCFAEACLNPEFADYDLIFDNIEDGALMDWERFFGKTTAQRVIAPRMNKNNPVYSATVQDFYFHLDCARQRGKPVVYVLDSMDALTSEQAQKKVVKKRTAHRKMIEGEKPEDVAGSFGADKAKANSEGMSEVMAFLRDSRSILLIISQTRDNINAGLFGDKRTRSGGRSLTFYATLEMWTAQAGHIKKKIKGKDRELGIYSKIRVKKNRILGKDRTITVPIYHSVGIDDVGSCIDFLLEEGCWSKNSAGRISATEFDFEGKREQIVRYVEENELERELQNIVAECWNDIEEACTVIRKQRYE